MEDTFVAATDFVPDINELDFFFDERYRSRDLPDDFFISYVPDALNSDNDVFIEREYDPDHETGVVRKVVLPDCAQDNYTIEMGPRMVNQPSIYIEPDYVPSLITLRWYMDFMRSDIPIELPYIPVAKMNIPTQALEVSPAIAAFDDFFSERDGLIYAPYYQFTQTQPSYKFVVGDLEAETNRLVNGLMQKYNYAFIFSSKYPFRKSLADYGYKMIWLEFNPCHPCSPRMIVDYSLKDGIISGSYRWGRKTKNFLFDTNDTKFRIHSEVWSRIFPNAYKYMASFDIVGNFDFLEILPELMSPPIQLYKYPGRYLVGYYSDSDHDIYSPMIGSRTSKDRLYCYFSNCPVQIKDDMSSSYVNITSRYEVLNTEGRDYDVKVVRFGDRRLICRITISGSYECDPNYFVVYTMKGNLGVYIKEDNMNFEFQNDPLDSYINNYVICRKIFVEGIFYRGLPRNSTGSLIDPMGVVDYDQFVKQSRECVMSFYDSTPLSEKGSLFKECYEEMIHDQIDTAPDVIIDDVDIPEDKEKETKVIYDDMDEMLTILPERVTRGMLVFDGSNQGKDSIDATPVGRAALLAYARAKRTEKNAPMPDLKGKVFRRRKK